MSARQRSRDFADQAALAEVATNDSDSDVRKAAVKKLVDQGVLADDRQ